MPKSPSAPPGLWLADRMMPPSVLRVADHGRGRRRRQQPVPPDHDAGSPVRRGHLQDGLDRRFIEVAPVAADGQRLAADPADAIEDRLHEVLEVARLHEGRASAPADRTSPASAPRWVWLRPSSRPSASPRRFFVGARVAPSSASRGVRHGSASTVVVEPAIGRGRGFPADRVAHRTDHHRPPQVAVGERVARPGRWPVGERLGGDRGELEAGCRCRPRALPRWRRSPCRRGRRCARRAAGQP